MSCGLRREGGCRNATLEFPDLCSQQWPPVAILTNRDEIFLKNYFPTLEICLRKWGVLGLVCTLGRGNQLPFQESGGIVLSHNPTPTPATYVSLKSMAVIYPSIRSQCCFFGIGQTSSGNFQPAFVFPYSLIKDTKKLFPTPPALLQGSKLNSAMRQTAGCGLGTGQQDLYGVALVNEKENLGCVRSRAEMLHTWNCFIGRDLSISSCPTQSLGRDTHSIHNAISLASLGRPMLAG